MDLRAGAALSRAIVTGSGGQDGTYLTRLLEEKGYTVVGVERGGVDLTDGDAVRGLLRDVRPRELYNLASPSFVPESWRRPVETARTGCLAVATLLEAVLEVDPSIRLFQASSAEVFGDADEVPQTEATPYRPRSPYGAAKAFADFLVASFRARHGLHASCGILFNHESPLRPREFLPSKVAHGVAAIAAGRERELVLGDLDARRDWGWAPDYVDAMWRMLQQDEPGDYVIATGEAHTVRELVELAFAHRGLDWREHVRVDEALVRPGGRALVGDPARARQVLGWRPTVGFEELVGRLVDAALAQTGS
ncbi:MAG TPA: GDP-mannose 4,6-dehydratase [Gaiellaceae bacterium]|nr:GDP-mannose 4,6-dehydratase [Gaiellaceae bacterium]